MRDTQGQGRRGRRGGHTVIETMIVLALVAVLVSMAVPRLDYTTLRLDANVRVVRGAMQQAWRLAIQTQHDVLLSVDVAAHRIRIIEDADQDGQPSAGDRVIWRSLEDGAVFDVPPAGLAGSVGAPLTGPGVRQVTSLPTIVFRRNGAASSDAELYLSAEHRGNRSWRAITLAQATGRTEWFRLAGGVWRSGGI